MSTSSDTALSVAVAPLIASQDKKVFVSPPGPAFTAEQLDGTMTHRFILSVGDAEYYVFFRDPFNGRNVYEWVKASNADEARLLFDHAPRIKPLKNNSEGSRANG